MKHTSRTEAIVQALLRRTRTIAVIGASPRPGRHSGEAVTYLHHAGYDVVPIRPDRARVAGLPTYANLDDVGGSVDLVVVFRRPGATPDHIREAAEHGAFAVWLPPGVWSRAAEEEAQRGGLLLVKDQCIIESHRHLAGARGDATSGHPRKTGVHIGRRRHTSADETISAGYVEGGGGGRRAGGGHHAVLDEKKMKKR